MKNIFILLILFTCLFGITSCDFVTVPEQSGTNLQSTENIQRKVLLEDYTGHKCTACPAAAIVANNLLQTYGNKVIVMAVHAGYFAQPQAPATLKYVEDFRTPAGDIYDSPTFFDISNQGNPNGLINRKNYSPGTVSHIKAPGSWATEVQLEIAKPAMVKIEITNTYNVATRSLGCNVKSTFLSDTITGGPYKLVVVITQDSIVADQLDAGVYTSTYTHRHVLRDNINGTWGDVVATSGAIILNAPITKNYVYVLPNSYPASAGPSATTCNPSHCYVVAFIYNDATKEVIQAEEIKVIP